MCLHDHHFENLKKLNYTPVGLGTNKFGDEWLNDKSGENMSTKINIMVNILFIIGWKNFLPKYNEDFWLTFRYRYHWAQDKKIKFR